MAHIQFGDLSISANLDGDALQRVRGGTGSMPVVQGGVPQAKPDRRAFSAASTFTGPELDSMTTINTGIDNTNCGNYGCW